MAQRYPRPSKLNGKQIHYAVNRNNAEQQPKHEIANKPTTRKLTLDVRKL